MHCSELVDPIHPHGHMGYRSAAGRSLDRAHAQNGSLLTRKRLVGVQGEMLRGKAKQEAAGLLQSEKTAKARAQQALWETTQVRLMLVMPADFMLAR